jgi:6-phosphofructo-2-kinase / fructose-2,6-biphosphatase 4
MEIDENSKEAPTKEDADKTMVGVEQEKIPRGDPYDLTPSQVKVIEKQQMSEINPGVWDGYTAAEIKARFPDEWENFMKDPYGSRARRAESYHDLSSMCRSANALPSHFRLVRLEPVIIEMERHEEDLLIIGHASVIRCLLAYLIGLPASELPALEVARGDLIEVMPTSYGVVSHAFHFWDGPGRAGGHDETNFYENFAEDTMDKKPKVPL